MIAIPRPQKMTVEDYLVWEPQQEFRYEFVNGHVFAMAGGTLAHNDIAVNLLTALRPHLRKQGCRINIADAKVNVTPTLYRYPDLVVTCDQRDKVAVDAIQFPKLIVEVLSSGTEAVDRGDKLKEYCNIPSLEAYVLVSSKAISVEVYRRSESWFWLYTMYASGDVVGLESVGFECPVELLYEDIVAFEPRDSD